MENYMVEVARILGVEMGEEFEIKFPSPSSVKATAVFSESGFRVVDTDAYILTPYWKESLLHSLLKGDLTIKHKPWKPSENELFWHIDVFGNPVLDKWTGHSYHLTLYKLGNCYRTEVESKKDLDKWVDFYASDEVLEV